MEPSEPKQQPIRIMGAWQKEFFAVEPIAYLRCSQVTLAADSENSDYVSLMRGVEFVMSDPGPHDLPISRIFTHAMFLDLRQELADQVNCPYLQAPLLVTFTARF
jgi:hypothetical protein